MKPEFNENGWSVCQVRESHAKRERTKAGLETARQEGRIGGRRAKLTLRQQAEMAYTLQEEKIRQIILRNHGNSF